jgi:beta-galactosidase
VDKYDGNIDALNSAWGNVFWSMTYRSFEEIDLPNLAVTELNPSHRLDFFRYSSDKVVEFSNLQAAIIRKFSSKPLTTNFMGFFFQFDAFKLAESLDFATWDSYPLGFTDTTLGLGDIFTEDEKRKYSSTGHPDLASFHHDLYRAIGKGRFWIMEQQPGPVNWGDHNPSPAPDMVRLWSIEAAAHGADIVSYFRWRQVPFGQEQMHSGLNRGDYEKDSGYFEAQRFLKDIQDIRNSDSFGKNSGISLPRALILFSFESQWVQDIEPQSKSYSFVSMVFNFYSSLRSLGYQIDFMSLDSFGNLENTQQMEGFNLIVVPGLSTISSKVSSNLEKFNGDILFGPRTGSKTENFQNPTTLPPDQPLQKKLLPLKITRVESYRPGVEIPIKYASSGASYKIQLWREKIELAQKNPSNIAIDSVFEDQGLNGYPASVTVKVSPSLRSHYLAFFPDTESLTYYIANHIESAKPLMRSLGELRLVSRDGIMFAINYGSESVTITEEISHCSSPEFILGSSSVEPQGASAWKCSALNSSSK